MKRLLLLLWVFAAAAEAAQAVDPTVLKALQTAQTAQQRGDYAGARRALESTGARPGSLEQALVWRSQGYLAWAEGQSGKALGLLEKAYASGQLSAEDAQNERFNIARLSLAEERYPRVVELLAPLPAAADAERVKMLVQAYQGLGQYRQALPLAERYVQSHPDAEDAWLQLLVGGHVKLKQFDQAEQWQRRLLKRHVDSPAAWWQLAGVQQMAGREARAVATLRAARARGLAFSERELDNLVALASAADQPWQGARMLEAMLAQGLLPGNLARQERLALLWWQARERPAAATVYRQLANSSGKAAHWLSLAQLELEQANWQAGLDALRLAERAGADRRQVHSWRQWAESEMAFERAPQVAQAR